MDILIADTDPARAETLAARLAVQAGAGQAGVGRIRIAPPLENLALIVAAERPDIVIVDMARADRDSLEHLRSIAAHQMPVMLFIDEDDPAFMEEAISAGVVSYHVNAAGITDIKPILRSAIALYRHASARDVRLAAAEAELSDRRLIDGAKRLLMRRDNMSEPAAHRFLQRRAMERQMRLADVARALLAAPSAGESGDYA
ncbi:MULTISPECIES: ANTAR domain-containing response regulator [Acidiphilium]|uniref:Response regulator receiver and ANTAR domain protein n=1 Tax=Acidiphilium rubrum TaxID=526 RepID=A0A8G2FFF9_ACIRU|nr:MULTISPECIES: ANTAR domain-containing protein [Acidiphilium]SIR42213.1 response regulator receiver and ANTAR domain protein [Acidiphilium rubrum]